MNILLNGLVLGIMALVVLSVAPLFLLPLGLAMGALTFGGTLAIAAAIGLAMLLAPIAIPIVIVVALYRWGKSGRENNAPRTVIEAGA